MPSDRDDGKFAESLRLYSRYILPGLIDWACGQPSGVLHREKVIPFARGRVLEVGIGSGMNLPYYRGAEVDHLTAIDPLEELWERKQTDLATLEFEVDFIKGSAHRIPFDDESFDTVVSTSTLCSIKEVEKALKEMYRVLKPGGKLLFEEHGAAPDASLARHQNRLNPVWKRISGGCNLNRNIRALLEAAGFTAEGMAEGYQDGWKATSYHYWGYAGKLLS